MQEPSVRGVRTVRQVATGGVMEPWMSLATESFKRHYIEERWGNDPSEVEIACFYLERMDRLTTQDAGVVTRLFFPSGSPSESRIRVVESALHPGRILRIVKPERMSYGFELRGIYRPLRHVEFTRSVVVRTREFHGRQHVDSDNAADFSQLIESMAD